MTVAAAGGFVGLLSLFNMAGRFVWSSTSDVIGRKPIYMVYLGVGMVLYLYGGRAYLHPKFFCATTRLAPERVRLEATRAGSAVAGALFFETQHGLYGRYWGCDENIEFLHFEASYYAGIERCIALGLPLFEAGAQGEHKLLRGFEPVICHSAHSLRHPGLDHGVRLREETLAIAQHVRELDSFGPYREPKV